MNKIKKRFHSHPFMEKKLGVDENHVIIDKDIFLEIMDQINNENVRENFLGNCKFIFYNYEVAKKIYDILDKMDFKNITEFGEYARKLCNENNLLYSDLMLYSNDVEMGKIKHE